MSRDEPEKSARDERRIPPRGASSRDKKTSTKEPKNQRTKEPKNQKTKEPKNPMPAPGPFRVEPSSSHFALRRPHSPRWPPTASVNSLSVGMRGAGIDEGDPSRGGRHYANEDVEERDSWQRAKPAETPTTNHLKFEWRAEPTRSTALSAPSRPSPRRARIAAAKSWATASRPAAPPIAAPIVLEKATSPKFGIAPDWSSNGDALYRRSLDAPHRRAPRSPSRARRGFGRRCPEISGIATAPAVFPGSPQGVPRGLGHCVFT